MTTPLLAAHQDVHRVFDRRVADYVIARPDYPPALIDWLRGRPGISAHPDIADIGAGTGLLTRALLPWAARVWAVEPSAPMRDAALHSLGHDARFRAVDGSAEATGLPAASVDLVTAAQCFHWWSLPAATRECVRVLRPGAGCALIWNDRLDGDPLHEDMNELFDRYGSSKRAAMLAQPETGEVPRFFAGTYERFEAPHNHRLSREGLQALAFSRSYMPRRDTPDGEAATAAFDALFERHVGNAGVSDAPATVEVRYTTIAFFGQPDPQAR